MRRVRDVGLLAAVFAGIGLIGSVYIHSTVGIFICVGVAVVGAATGVIAGQFPGNDSKKP